MTDKMLVTQEQADAIEYVLYEVYKGNKDEFLDFHAFIEGLWDIEQALPLKNFIVSELAKALYIGYVIE